jgi:adenylate cyclase
MNYREEAIDLLGIDGTSILSLHHSPGTDLQAYDATQGDVTLSGFGFVQNVLMGKVDDRGDKFSGLARSPWGDYFYLVGPVRDAEGNLAGVIAVGKSLTQLTQQIRQDTLAHVSIYALDGSLVSSTLFHTDTNQAIPLNSILEILGSQDDQSSIREYSVGSERYSEIMGPWEARGGQDLGIVGTALAQNFITRPSLVTRFQVIAIVTIAVVGVIILGLFLAHQITSPLSDIVKASIEIAKGNLEVKVPTTGNDEVTVLAHAFNYMVSGLQEGFIYRDILGRTVSPEVREAMRQSFASGDLRLEGQSVIATVVMSDIRGFTALAEKENPTTILKWLNEYFGIMTPVITANGGVVDKFEGDAILAFFGILPRPLTGEESAYQACKAALRLVEVINDLNAIRAGRGEAALITGIGVNTGTLIAGGLGASDRLNYTVIGDVVNTTQRIESVTKSFGAGGVVISESTLTSLKDHRGEFHFEPLGEHALKGKSDLIWLYRLHSRGEAEASFGEWDVRFGEVSQGIYEENNLVEE